MPHLIDLIKEYKKLKEKDLNVRSIFVLEMMEKVITFPPTEPYSEKDVSVIDEYVSQLVRDLRRDKQYLFSVRISKIWKQREHLIQMAKTWHEVQKDYIDEIEYHQEIKWLRDKRRKLIENQRKSTE